MTNPFEDELPPSANELDLMTLVGCAAIFCVGGCHPDQYTRFGIKPVVRASIVILNGPLAGQEIIDKLLFNSRVVRRLRGVPGKAFVAHIDKDESFTQPAVVLLDADPDELKLAVEWNNEHVGRVQELVAEAVVAFTTASAGEQHQQRPAQQPAQQRNPAPSSPPRGPGQAQRSAPPTGSDSPPPPAQLDEPPF